ncbi:putative aldehyde dehydrogenase [Aspergillus chevalieri]|uniref:Aldehyde dehydrogenase domain-containing protein n=1 Tax=Aspergillus chevalieri TaxID=182096 RepID=A0A7R7ZT95_ASPCH|nr:uncharacterized protein ACHE_80349A [Aspergillus chevalieri]BCR92449.1 hypothetical protein ACHE_80349A [Aspergillus chevalieri]
MIPLIINNTDTLDPSSTNQTPTYQGATPSHTLDAISSAAAAFPSWSCTAPSHRRDLLRAVARLLHERGDELTATMQAEMHAPEVWARANVQFGIGLLEETAGLISDAMMGGIPVSQGESYAMVLKQPMGVVLGIAPWNAPVILGLRAVVAPLAAGNTVIFRGADLSPKSHYLLASLFRDAGFPPGVLNFLLNRPEDAPELYELTINHPSVRKCNFTGSTQVGRIIASKAAYALKPVLLELGGKNFALVLDDARIEEAAEEIVKGTFLNNGQICMSTDLVYVTEATAPKLEAALLNRLHKMTDKPRLISCASKSKLTFLLEDARINGATIHHPPSFPSPTEDQNDATFPPTLLTNLAPSSAFHTTESFGPLVGIVRTPDLSTAMDLITNSTYGLSASIFTSSHFTALKLAEKMRVGAVHVNGMTVHDEPTLPHGGVGESGFGRFGGKWGVEEFLEVRTVILNP